MWVPRTDAYLPRLDQAPVRRAWVAPAHGGAPGEHTFGRRRATRRQRTATDGNELSLKVLDVRAARCALRGALSAPYSLTVPRFVAQLRELKTWGRAIGQYLAVPQELQRLRADHGPKVVEFEVANRAYFAASISDRVLRARRDKRDPHRQV